MKSITEIAWNVTEDEYRSDEAVSYSSLSTFLREGPSCIPRIKDKKEAEALRFGSLVDCLLLEPEVFKERFLIADMPKLSDSIIKIVSQLFNENKDNHRTLDSIPEAIRFEMIERENYASTWKVETRIKDITTKGSEYYSLSYLAGDRLLMSTEDYNTALRCVEELKSNRFTRDIFSDSIFEFTGVEKLNQLKFKSAVSNYPVRCMMDRIIVDHNNKTIRPIDLKTSGKPEFKFEDSFEQWCYFIQGTMYTQIIKSIIEVDDYFKDFTILPYYFIVINRDTLAPLIWAFNDNHAITKLCTTNMTRSYPSWIKLVFDYNWHIENNEFKYTREAIDNNGVLLISNIFAEPLFK